jgi:hypothetical protein
MLQQDAKGVMKSSKLKGQESGALWRLRQEGSAALNVV